MTSSLSSSASAAASLPSSSPTEVSPASEVLRGHKVRQFNLHCLPLDLRLPPHLPTWVFPKYMGLTGAKTKQKHGRAVPALSRIFSSSSQIPLSDLEILCWSHKIANEKN